MKFIEVIFFEEIVVRKCRGNLLWNFFGEISLRNLLRKIIQKIFGYVGSRIPMPINLGRICSEILFGKFVREVYFIGAIML